MVGRKHIDLVTVWPSFQWSPLIRFSVYNKSAVKFMHSS